MTPRSAGGQTGEKNGLDHFLAFITSPKIVQILPFGKRPLTLNSGARMEISQVIRKVLPSRLIKQYNQNCSEEDYALLSTCTLLRILAEACVTPVRKSLFGLYSYATEEGLGFDDNIDNIL